jgi:hypothetical protein
MSKSSSRDTHRSLSAAIKKVLREKGAASPYEIHKDVLKALRVTTKEVPFSSVVMMLEEIRSSKKSVFRKTIGAIFRAMDPRDLNFRYGVCNCESCRD